MEIARITLRKLPTQSQPDIGDSHLYSHGFSCIYSACGSCSQDKVLIAFLSIVPYHAQNATDYEHQIVYLCIVSLVEPRIHAEGRSFSRDFPTLYLSFPPTP